MAVEAPIRNMTFSFAGRAREVDLPQARGSAKSFWEYGPIAGRPESSEDYWVPVEWMAWKLLVGVLRIHPERLK